jgi:cysteine synthase A
MARIYQSFTELIGRTPLLALRNYQRSLGLKAELLAKLEYFNPAGSVKDRVAKAMIEDAETKGGFLKPGAVIVEPTQLRNTGIGLAAVAAVRVVPLILTMPESMSIERRKLLKALGAELVLTDGAKGMQGAVEKAQALAAEIPDAFIPGQFDNPANPAAHEASTGPEIWRDTEGELDFFVAGVGTGGTLTGTGRYLKEQNPAVRVAAVEPDDSPVLSEGRAGAHQIQGIGANFVPKVLDAAIYDEIIRVGHTDAYAAARALCKTEGVLAGVSSGAALWAAAQIAGRVENAGKRVVVLLPDAGERYLSTPLFED